MFSLVIITSCLITSCAKVDVAVDRIADACSKVIPIAQTASLVPIPPAAEIASYVIIACETTEGLTKLRSNPDSVKWLDDMHIELENIMKKKHVQIA